jgi:DNA-3-methyladenine glycosylase II
MRRIRTKADLKEGVAALVASCGHMARLHAFAGDPSLRRRPAGFKGLVRVIVAQQLSVASAGAIWDRLETTLQPFTAAALLALPDRDLRSVGLSAGKIATLRGVATAILTRALDLESLAAESDATIHEQLTKLKGIGPWTADIYMLFCLARADAWSPGDLALQHSVRDLIGLKARPGQAEMLEIAETWRPWRSVAARMLWRYYKLRRVARSGAPA